MKQMSGLPPHYTLKRRRPPRRNKDVAVLGLLLGLIVPALAVIVLYFLQFRDYQFGAYLKMFVRFDNPYMMEQSSKLISLSMIGNLIPFYYFLNRKYYQTTRGVIMATMLLGVLIVLYKFVWQ